MHDVILRHNPKLGVEGSKRTIVILPVVVDCSLLRRLLAIKRIHQRGFASAGATDNDNELARRDSKRDIVKQHRLVVAYPLEMVCLNANAATLIVLGELGSRVDELERSYADLISCFERLLGDTLAIDIHMIGAAQVNKAMAAISLLQARMIAGDLWVVQDNAILWQAANGDDRRVQQNGPNLWERFLWTSTTIAELRLKSI